MPAYKPDDMLTVEEVTTLLRCSRATVWRMIKAGRLRRYNLNGEGTAVRIRYSDVDRIYNQSFDEKPRPDPAMG